MKGSLAETPEEARNKAIVLEFYEKAINQKDFAAAEPYFGETYTQHNPTAEDGKEGFKNFLQFVRGNWPNLHTTIKAAWADGDYVILHVHAQREPNVLGKAVVDIFRLENGKIVEHWDVIQDIPATSLSGNSMF